MKFPIQKLSHLIKEVTLPSLIFQSEPHFGHRDVWVGGRVSKGSGFCIYVLLLFYVSPFCDVQWLAGSPFYKAVIQNSLLFQNLDPFCNHFFFFFVVLPNLQVGKFKLCPILLMPDWFHAWLSE